MKRTYQTPFRGNGPRFQIMRKTPLLVSALLLAFTASACRKKSPAADAAETAAQPVVIGPENIALVRQETIRSGPILSGSLQPAEDAAVRAEIAGSVMQTYAEAGQPVGRGQLLARLDDRAIRDQVVSARSAVSTAQANYTMASREVERTQSLVSAGAIAERALEQVRTQQSAAAAQLANARAQLASAEKMVGNTEVRAPFAGVVATRSASAGDVVSPGSPLFTVVNPSTMRLEAAIPAEAIGEVRLGMPVEFSVTGYNSRAFTGRITRISPTADPATKQVSIIATIPNVGGTLVGGLFAQGRVSSQQKVALVVPTGAVDERGIRPQVMRIKAGHVEVVQVELGVRDQQGEIVEVRSPQVTVGDTVLLGAARAVSPGAPVRVGTIADQPKR